MIVSTALACLALNVYHEARGESVPGQYAVALVTMNRAEGDPGRVCETVFKRRQFSWANKHTRKVAAGWQLSPRLRPKDEAAWQRAQTIASWTMQGRMSDFTHGSTHFHTHAVRPRWRLALTPTRTLGNHRFYRVG